MIKNSKQYERAEIYFETSLPIGEQRKRWKQSESTPKLFINKLGMGS